MDKIAEKRGLGVRQTYRVLRKGVEAIASMLQDRMRAPVAAGSASMVPSAIPSSAAHQTQLAQAEVSRLYQSGNIESLCVRDLLREVLTLLAPLCRREGSQIALSMAGAYPSVIAQRTVLRHGLLGLLTHALETTAQGDLAVAVCPAATGIRIEITGRVDDSKRLPSDPADEQQTGSGQAVAQTLIESQGGRVEVARREGQWRTQVFLPTEGRSTILVVDDNADLVALVKRYLTGYAVNTVGVTDASETLRLAGELRPRLILLDVLLPGQDGWEILRGLKRSPDTGDIPVVICSVLDERRLGETMGAVEYISKPVTQEHLLAVLGRWLGPLRPAV
jgi:CheY-like chemotaxis protein